MSADLEKPQGPGALLEAARRRQGQHIAALATLLKVSPGRLEALEAERWDELPDPTYARALATSVCRVLGIDAAPVLAGMPRSAGAALERVSAGLNEPVREGAGWPAATLRWGLPIALLVILAGVGLKFWPDEPAPPALSTAVELPAAEAPAQPTASQPEPLASSPASAAVPLPVTSPPASQVAAVTPPASPAALAPAGAGLELRAVQGASWVSVVDAAGNSLASRLLQQGESLSLPTTGAPLRLVLGNAPALSLSWRGQAQALAGYEQRRVAKLELK